MSIFSSLFGSKEERTGRYSIQDLNKDEASLDALFKGNSGLRDEMEMLGYLLCMSRIELVQNQRACMQRLGGVPCLYLKEEFETKLLAMKSIVYQKLQQETFDQILTDAASDLLNTRRLTSKQAQTVGYWSLLCPVLQSEHLTYLPGFTTGPDNKKFVKEYDRFFKVIAHKAGGLPVSSWMKEFVFSVLAAGLLE